MTEETYPLFFSNAIFVLAASTDTSAQLILGASAFLLILVAVAWWLSTFAVMCLSQKYLRIVDQAHLSASDFSIMLENVPIHYSA
jgi:hypothetical protein